MCMHQMLQSYTEELTHVIVVQRIKNGLALPAGADQLGVLEGAQLMADGALGHAKQFAEVADAQLAFEQGVEDADAGGIAKHPEQIGQVKEPVVVGHQTVDFLQIGMCVIVGATFAHGIAFFRQIYEQLFIYQV